MKTIFKYLAPLLLCVFALKWAVAPCHGAMTNYTAIIAITNAPTGTNGETIVIQGNTCTWTNAAPIVFQIASTNNLVNSTTNLFNALSNNWGGTLRFSYASSTSIKISTYINGSLTIALGGNWATNQMSTNIITGGATAISLTISNVTALSFTLGGIPISSWSGIPFPVPASTTNWINGFVRGVVETNTAAITNWVVQFVTNIIQPVSYVNPTIYSDRRTVLVTNLYDPTYTGTYTNFLGNMTNTFSIWKIVGGATKYLTKDSPDVIANEGQSSIWALGTATNDFNSTLYYNTHDLNDFRWLLTGNDGLGGDPDDVIGHIADFQYTVFTAPAFTSYPQWPKLTSGKSFYVQQTLGNDNNDGHTLLAPLRSIAMACERATNPGDTIFVGSGSYGYGNLRPLVNIYGSGQNCTFFTNSISFISGGEFAYFTANGTASFGQNSNYMYWHDVTVDSTPYGQVDALGVFVVTSATGSGLIQRCTFKSYFDAAAVTFNTGDYMFEGNRFIAINPYADSNIVSCVRGFNFNQHGGRVTFNNNYFYITNGSFSVGASDFTNSCFLLAKDGGTLRFNNNIMDYADARNGVPIATGPSAGGSIALLTTNGGTIFSSTTVISRVWGETTNYVAANFIPQNGCVTFPASNDWIFMVTDRSTNALIKIR